MPDHNKKGYVMKIYMEQKKLPNSLSNFEEIAEKKKVGMITIRDSKL